MPILDEVRSHAPLPHSTGTDAGEVTTVRVLLVDDYKLMRESLRALISGLPDIEVVGEAGDGPSAIELVRTLAPDVVVMDVVMPGMNGIEATRRIRAEHQRVRVIAVSSHMDTPYVKHMLAAGACAYVLKIAAHEDLVRAVRGARLDKIFLSAAILGPSVKTAMNFDPYDEVG